MKKKIKRIQIFRLAVQLLMFILSPGLFILAFSGFKSIYEMIIKGDLNFIQVFPSLIEFVTAIIITIVLGRFFCGWICAFGTYNDLLHLLSKHVFKINFKVNEKLDAALKYVKYLVLLLLIVVVWTMGSSVLDTTSPWDAFALITDFPQVLSDYTIGVVFLILITVGAFFVERFFCRYLCPLGAVFNIFSRIGILKIIKPSEKCGKCRVCTNNCSMGLPLYKVESVCGGDCINCFKCIETCPRNNTKVNVLGENINPELASSLAIAAMVGLYGVNNLGGIALAKSGLTTTSSSSTNTTTSTTSTSQKYTDGTYTGTGTGYRGGTTEISVTIKDNKIANIETVSNQDTPRFYENVESEIISEMISNQSTSVDTISGATYSCEGIINATQDALTQAEASSTASTASISTADESTTDTSTGVASSDSSVSTSSNDNSSTTTNDETSTANTTDDSASITTKDTVSYTDGTYTGTGTGYRRGTTEMSVTIKDNKIISIETVSNQDTPRFYENVESGIISEIISAQSTSVDTISGATYSCEGIISATQDALSQAKV
ncbi:FMN-binding protein [Clostridium lacusfryxellense]|uniref:FMN-binding protein n=1 Tax=Clostridium lacusfryxellense TaxID=205328 RepID=UPI001C0DC23A|nr:FMN-binding protein [Clostridium lacusfryxellense]MBU3113197.1 FMN-binding protein [Clostridium lacusfryxellense]